MFGDYLITSAVLQKGNIYTFTFEHGRLFEYNSDSAVTEDMKYYMKNYGEVISASRAFFSDRYVIIILSTSSYTLSDWLTAFKYSWDNMGYGNANFLFAEGGYGSSQAGGVTAITAGVGSSVGSTIAATLKPLTPYLIGGGIILIAIEFFRRK
ncbi:MAG: hypothetical protein ABIG95_02540 [Candidatus Woesearchaeota archaeon]